MKEGIIFAAGALTGSAAAYIFLKEKFAQKSQDEIDSVIQAFRGEEPQSVIENPAEPAQSFTEKSSIDEMTATYQTKLRDYRKAFEAKTKEDEMRERTASIPYVISPSEVNFDEYDSTELIYYADGVLADTDDHVVTDIPGMVGDALQHFGEYEDDSVLVNNDRLKLCIEIIRDSRTYKDVTGVAPPDGGGD